MSINLREVSSNFAIFPHKILILGIYSMVPMNEVGELIVFRSLCITLGTRFHVFKKDNFY